jgi:preprotein translocase subunit SecF
VRFRDAVSAFRGHRRPDLRIIPRWKGWFALSGFFIVLSLIGLFVRGLNYSIDFKGGAQLKYPNPKAITADQVEAVMGRFGRSDAQVQVVAGKGGSLITIRTRSLNDLGGPPQTQFTYPNPKGLGSDDVRATLASLGLGGAAVSISPGKVVATTPPVSSLAESQDIVLVYHPKKALTADQVRAAMSSAGQPGASVTVAGGTVAIVTGTLEAAPAATQTPSTSASASPSARGSASPSASASGTTAPSPSPTPASAVDIKRSLAEQAGISASDIIERNLSSIGSSDILRALASQEGIQPAAVKMNQLGGDERARLLRTLAVQAGIGTASINIEDFSPTWGSQISKKALQGLIIFLFLVAIYIAFRFEWKMAASALTALAHDLIITVGIYALVGREVTPASVIAVLTILGYSLYDTVVIFDRVKENTESVALVARDTYSGVVNLSLNETLMRSLNTSLVVLLPILSLLLFGGETLKDFAFALFIGVASGAYSSIFIASPMLALLKEREPRYQQIRTRALRAARAKPTLRAVSAGARALPTSVASGDGGTEAPAAARPVQRQQASAGRPGGAKSKGKGKRKTSAAKRRRR